MSVLLVCDICGGQENVETYYLVRYQYRRDKTTNHRSIGGSDLCADCVQRIVSRDVRTRRARRQVAEQERREAKAA